MATHPARAISALSDRDRRGSTPRKTVNPTARHATPEDGRVPDREQAELGGIQGPQRSGRLGLAGGQHEDQAASPVWVSAVTNPAPIHNSSHNIRLYWPIPGLWPPPPPPAAGHAGTGRRRASAGPGGSRPTSRLVGIGEAAADQVVGADQDLVGESVGRIRSAEG